MSSFPPQVMVLKMQMAMSITYLVTMIDEIVIIVFFNIGDECHQILMATLRRQRHYGWRHWRWSRQMMMTTMWWYGYNTADVMMIMILKLQSDSDGYDNDDDNGWWQWLMVIIMMMNDDDNDDENQMVPWNRLLYIVLVINRKYWTDCVYLAW